ncbi:MAG TPA: hypothetical protein VEA38_13200, partial [Terriglobales bacterium]|nr:hypothetical protein [Terriglobales bacterium]
KMKIAPADLEALFKEPRLGLHVYPASKQRAALDVVFRGAGESKYLDKVPAASIVYDGLR